MVEVENFRSALNGFKREDVVHYIEYINNKHNTQVNQLKAEIQTMQSELNRLHNEPVQDSDLIQQLEASQAKCAALEQELAEARTQLEQASSHQAATPTSNEELEAYRRAERTERLAQERAAQLSAQANGIIADATAKVDEAAAQVAGLADQVAAQMGELQSTILGSKSVLQDAAATLYALRPVPPEK